MTHKISYALLEAVLTDKNFPLLFSGEATHNPARDISYKLVQKGASDEFITAIIDAALPTNYAGDTLRELPRMIEGARAREATGFDSPVMTAKPTIVQRVTDLATRTFKLFHDADGEAYMGVPTINNGQLCYRINSKNGKRLIIKLQHDAKFEKFANQNALNEIVASLEARAMFDSPEIVVARRIGRTKDAIFIDLGKPTGEVVCISANGWRIEKSAPIAFVRDDSFLPLVDPVLVDDPDQAVTEYFDLLGLGEDNRTLSLGFMLNCLRGKGPYMCMLVEGPQGSGKSFLSRKIKELIDPSSVQSMPLTMDEQNLMLQASTYFLPVYDNSSGMKGNISDILCTISTGGSLSKRRLYADGEMFAVSVCGPFIINGIGDFVTRPDLLERSIPIQLEELRNHRPEDQLNKMIDEQRPRFLGALYSAVALAIREEEDTIITDRVRMIDSARWITAAEPSLGIKSGRFVQVLRNKQTDTTNELVNNEPIVAHLRQIVADEPFIGMAVELLEICTSGRHIPQGIPHTPLLLSKTLKRLAPALSPTGLHIRFGKRNNSGRPITIWKDGQDPDTARPRPKMFNYT